MTFTVNTARGPVTWTGEDFDADPVTLREISNAWLNHRRKGFDFQLRRFLLPRLDDPIYSYLLLMSLYPDAVVVDGEAPYDLEVPLGAVDGGNAPNEFTKHYGPGPHPGTGTPQSIHGQGGTATLEPPTIVFRFLAEELQREYEDDIKRAVARFEEKFPGALPRRIVVRAANRSTPDAIFAYVDPLDDTPIIYINPNVSRWGMFGSAIEETNLIVAYRQAGGTKLERGETSFDEVEEIFFFHELAHLGANKLFGGPQPPVGYPRYQRPWYPHEILILSEVGTTIPSTYATKSAPEFFAEALADYAYSDSPVPYSIKIAELFKARET